MSIPSNLIPTRVSGLPTTTASEDMNVIVTYGGVTYQVRAGDLFGAGGAVPTSRQVIAGTGMAGGGQLTGDVTLNVAPNGVDSTLMSLTGVTPGSYGDGTSVPVLTIDSAGRVTTASTTPVSGATLSDGSYGDITVTVGGTVMTINDSVVTTAKMGGDVTAAGKALLDDADAAAQRDTLGLGTLATQDGTFVNPGTATTPTDFKDSVYVVATSNITLSGEQTIDGFLTSSSRVLAAGQTIAADRGWYTSSAGAWVRTDDADTSAEVTSGALTAIENGTVNGSLVYMLVTPDPITLGTTPLTFQAVAIPPGMFVVKTVAGTTYSTILTDSNKRLVFTNASAKTATVTRQAVVNAAVNTEIELFNAGAGLLTIAPDTGVTLNSFGTVLTIPQYHCLKVKKRANPNTWDVTGIGSSGITGTGDLVKANSPTLVTPALGTPSALVLTNATGLPVAGGGTGVATLTAYAPIFGGTTGTGAVQSGTVGTAGQALLSNGPGVLPTFQTLAATGGDLQVFTSGTSDWTKPSGVTAESTVQVICVGGGGGGGGAGSAAGSSSGGAGGGGGGYTTAIFTAAALTGTVSVTVGAGGGGGAGASNGNGVDGTQGGTSTFGAYLSAYGGGGGSGIRAGAGGGGGAGYRGSGATGTSSQGTGGAGGGPAGNNAAGGTDVFTYGAGGAGGNSAAGAAGIPGGYAALGGQGGGGGGAGPSAYNAANVVGGYGAIHGGITTNAGGAAAGNGNAGNPGTGTAGTSDVFKGAGGGGGGGATSSGGTIVGGAGAAGQVPGGGGGGGGGVGNSSASTGGAGGNGGNGIVLVITYI